MAKIDTTASSGREDQAGADRPAAAAGKLGCGRDPCDGGLRRRSGFVGHRVRALWARVTTFRCCRHRGCRFLATWEIGRDYLTSSRFRRHPDRAMSEETDRPDDSAMTENYGEDVHWEPQVPRLRLVRTLVAWVVSAAAVWVAAAILPGLDARPRRLRVPRRGADRGPQRDPAADPGGAATAVHARRGLHPAADRRRAAAASRPTRSSRTNPRRLVRRRAARLAADLGRDDRAAGDRSAPTTTTSTRCASRSASPSARAAAISTERPGDHLPRDRRARAADAARRDARRQRAERWRAGSPRTATT